MDNKKKQETENRTNHFQNQNNKTEKDIKK